MAEGSAPFDKRPVRRGFPTFHLFQQEGAKFLFLALLFQLVQNNTHVQVPVAGIMGGDEMNQVLEILILEFLGPFLEFFGGHRVWIMEDPTH